jgi:hypothetical protein
MKNPLPHDDPPQEHAESLWRLVTSPLIWAAHFMASYLTAAIWCAKVVPAGGTLQPVRWAIGAYTLVALLGIACNGWSGWQRHSFGAETLPHDYDTGADRHRFLGFATTLLAGLSAVATLFAGAAVFYFHDCR